MLVAGAERECRSREAASQWASPVPDTRRFALKIQAKRPCLRSRLRHPRAAAPPLRRAQRDHAKPFGFRVRCTGGCGAARCQRFVGAAPQRGAWRSSAPASAGEQGQHGQFSQFGPSVPSRLPHAVRRRGSLHHSSGVPKLPHAWSPTATAPRAFEEGLASLRVVPFSLRPVRPELQPARHSPPSAPAPCFLPYTGHPYGRLEAAHWRPDVCASLTRRGARTRYERAFA